MTALGSGRAAPAAAGHHTDASCVSCRVAAWRGVAWRGVARRGVAWRGVSRTRRRSAAAACSGASMARIGWLAVPLDRTTSRIVAFRCLCRADPIERAVVRYPAISGCIRGSNSSLNMGRLAAGWRPARQWRILSQQQREKHTVSLRVARRSVPFRFECKRVVCRGVDLHRNSSGVAWSAQ
jgi:hypothetical protein